MFPRFSFFFMYNTRTFGNKLSDDVTCDDMLVKNAYLFYLWVVLVVLFGKHGALAVRIRKENKALRTNRWYIKDKRKNNKPISDANKNTNIFLNRV